VTLIFDIGKTNKKVFLFDPQYNIIYEETQRFSEITDEDGFPCDDLDSLTLWILDTIDNLRARKEFRISAINFSSFGASFVHINEIGKPFLPLYSYLKPLAPELKQKFFNDYGGELKISRETASPVLDSLNSGLQLYRLKYEKSLTGRSGYSLHLPQYLSYLITRKVYSDITSIGCHTMLWNFQKNDYHEWVYTEGIAMRLAPLYPSYQLLDADRRWGNVKAGVGLHDSSAAIIPYLATFRDPFVVISTGTWSISLNPFNDYPLTDYELKQDCLMFLSYRRKVVKASRLFAGHDHEEQEKRIAAHFNKHNNYFEQVPFQHATSDHLENTFEQDQRTFFETGPSIFYRRDLHQFANYEEAYHQLMMDIVRQQVLSTTLVLDETDVKKIFVDGGFSKNDLYMHLMAKAFPQYQVYSASVAQASATGAALAINTGVVPEGLVKAHLVVY
jgi:sugar (pentulose or hexulose) kinase